MYWAVTEFGVCAGVEVTASHNPINYNGMKIVKSGSQPLVRPNIESRGGSQGLAARVSDIADFLGGVRV